MFEIKGKYSTAKIMIDSVEESCISQIYHFVNHPSFTNPIAIMPDCHSGKGSVIGFTMPLSNTVIPNVVGVDVGCGMLSMNFGKKTNIISLSVLDKSIRQKIPFGQEVHEQSVINMDIEFPWSTANALAQKFAQAYREYYGEIVAPHYDINWFIKKCDVVGGEVRRMINSIGTLGGGNHFIETGIDDDSNLWITIHSGSRNFGKRICEYWQSKAEKFYNYESKNVIDGKIEKLKNEITDGKLLFKKIKELKAEKKKPGIDMKGCEWLEGSDAIGYLFDMLFAQIYAQVNRNYMSSIIQKILRITPIDYIETIHNFIDFRDFIIRKGSVRSYLGERFMLPFNMRDGILICEGKSNPEWNYSAPHGAGRLMSRAQAKKCVELENFKNQMSGIYSTSIGEGTLDEAPDAYKPSKVIEYAIEPTATIIGRIKPIHNMKDYLGK